MCIRDSYRTQVAIKPEHHENESRPWHHNKSDRQPTYRQKVGWRQTNGPDPRESAKTQNKRVYEAQVSAIAGTSGTQRPSQVVDTPATSTKN